MTDNTSQFLDLVDGENVVWVTGVGYKRGDDKKPRNNIEIICSSLPTAESHTAPYTKILVGVPMSSDSTQAKIAMENRIKMLVYPLVGLETTEKVSLKELLVGAKANLDQNDFQFKLVVELKEGKGTDRNGNPIVFREVQHATCVTYQDKKPYESAIDFDDQDDLPF